MALTLTPPDHEPTTPEPELGVIVQARRRQRRRWLVTTLIAVTAVGTYVTLRVTSPARSGALLARPLHFPALRRGEPCPASSGYTVENSYFAGTALGRGPVRVLLADAGDVRHGRVDLGTGDAPRWFALQTLWFAMPGYDGPFVVRGGRLGRPGPIEVRPGGRGLSPGSGSLLVRAGATTDTEDGYRTVPGSAWVTSPGCYAWQVDGRGFSEVIVIDALAPKAPATGSSRA